MTLEPPRRDLLDRAVELRGRGAPFVMATVVRAVAPTSAKPGDKAILTSEGLVEGWVGGSCAEPIVSKEAQAALRDGACRLVCITPDSTALSERGMSEGIVVHHMSCYSGGAIDVYLEPYLPRPSLWVFGTSPVAKAIAALGRVMSYDVTCIDLAGVAPEGDDVVRSLDALRPVTADNAYAVVSSHGTFDEVALEHATRAGLAYTALVTSRKRRDQLFAGLAARGIARAALDAIDAPAGIDLGGRRPEEVALSVLAKIVALRNGREVTSRSIDGDKRSAEAPREAPAPEAPAPAAPKSCCHD